MDRHPVVTAAPLTLQLDPTAPFPNLLNSSSSPGCNPAWQPGGGVGEGHCKTLRGYFQEKVSGLLYEGQSPDGSSQMGGPPHT